jgi:hypothetical protein
MPQRIDAEKKRLERLLSGGRPSHFIDVAAQTMKDSVDAVPTYSPAPYHSRYGRSPSSSPGTRTLARPEQQVHVENSALRKENATLQHQLAALRDDVTRVFDDISATNARALERVQREHDATVGRLKDDIASMSRFVLPIDEFGEPALFQFGRAESPPMGGASRGTAARGPEVLRAVIRGALNNAKEIAFAEHAEALALAKVEWEEEHAERVAVETQRAVAAATAALGREHELELAAQLVERRTALNDAVALARKTAQTEKVTELFRREKELVGEANLALKEQRAGARGVLMLALEKQQVHHDAAVAALEAELAAQRDAHASAITKANDALQADHALVGQLSSVIAAQRSAHVRALTARKAAGQQELAAHVAQASADDRARVAELAVETAAAVHSTFAQASQAQAAADAENAAAAVDRAAAERTAAPTPLRAGYEPVTCTFAQVNAMRAELVKHPLGDVLNALFTASSTDVSRETFVRTLGMKLGLPRGDARQCVEFLFEAVAHAAGDEYGAASLPSVVVTAALATLCGGGAEATTAAVFEAFGTKATGAFALTEVQRFLHIVFLVTLGLAESEHGSGEVTTEHLARHSTRGEQLASAVVKSQFSAMHADAGGVVTTTEFQAFLVSMSGGGGGEPPLGNRTDDGAAASGADAAPAPLAAAAPPTVEPSFPEPTVALGGTFPGGGTPPLPQDDMAGGADAAPAPLAAAAPPTVEPSFPEPTVAIGGTFPGGGTPPLPQDDMAARLAEKRAEHEKLLALLQRQKRAEEAAEVARKRSHPRAAKGPTAKQRRRDAAARVATQERRHQDSPHEISGSLLKKSSKGKWQTRFFQTHGTHLLYLRKSGGAALGSVDLAGPQSKIELCEVAGSGLDQGAVFECVRVTGLDGDAHSGSGRQLVTLVLRKKVGEVGPATTVWYDTLVTHAALL